MAGDGLVHDIVNVFSLLKLSFLPLGCRPERHLFAVLVFPPYSLDHFGQGVGSFV